MPINPMTINKGFNPMRYPMPTYPPPQAYPSTYDILMNGSMGMPSMPPASTFTPPGPIPMMAPARDAEDLKNIIARRRVNRANRKMVNKLGRMGYQGEIPGQEEHNPNIVERFFDALNVGNYASAGLVSNLLNQDTAGNKWAEENKTKGWNPVVAELLGLGRDVVYEPLSKIFSRQGKGDVRTYADVLERGAPVFGWGGWQDASEKDWHTDLQGNPIEYKRYDFFKQIAADPNMSLHDKISNFGGLTRDLPRFFKSKGFWNDWGRGGIGFALDVALDPLTYVSWGMDDIAKQGARALGELQQAGKAMPGLRITNKEGAKAASRFMALQSMDDVLGVAGNLAKNSPQYMDDLTAKLATVGKESPEYLNELTRRTREIYKKVRKGSKSVGRYELPYLDLSQGKPRMNRTNWNILPTEKWEKTGIPAAVDAIIGTGGHRLPEDILGMPIFRSWKDQVKDAIENKRIGGLMARTYYKPADIPMVGDDLKVKTIRPDIVEPNVYSKQSWQPSKTVDTEKMRNLRTKGKQAWQRLVDDVGEEKAKQMWYSLRDVDVADIIEKAPDYDVASINIKMAAEEKLKGQLLEGKQVNFNADGSPVIKAEAEALKGQPVPEKLPAQGDRLEVPDKMRFANIPEDQKIIDARGNLKELPEGPYRIYQPDKSGIVTIQDGVKIDVKAEDVPMIRGQVTDKPNIAAGGKLHEDMFGEKLPGVKGWTEDGRPIFASREDAKKAIPEIGSWSQYGDRQAQPEVRNRLRQEGKVWYPSDQSWKTYKSKEAIPPKPAPPAEPEIKINPEIEQKVTAPAKAEAEPPINSRPMMRDEKLANKYRKAINPDTSTKKRIKAITDFTREVNKRKAKGYLTEGIEKQYNELQQLKSQLDQIKQPRRLRKSSKTVTIMNPATERELARETRDIAFKNVNEVEDLDKLKNLYKLEANRVRKLKLKNPGQKTFPNSDRMREIKTRIRDLTTAHELKISTQTYKEALEEVNVNRLTPRDREIIRKKPFLYDDPKERGIALKHKLSDKEFWHYKQMINNGASHGEALKQAKKVMPGSLTEQPKKLIKIERNKTDYHIIDDGTKTKLKFAKGNKKTFRAKTRKVLEKKHVFKSPDDKVNLEVYFEPTEEAIKRTGSVDDAWNELTDHYLSMGNTDYKEIRQFELKRAAAAVNSIEDIIKNPDAVIKQKNGNKIFFVKKYKNAGNHLLVGELMPDGRVRGITKYPTGQISIQADDVIYSKGKFKKGKLPKTTPEKSNSLSPGGRSELPTGIQTEPGPMLAGNDIIPQSPPKSQSPDLPPDELPPGGSPVKPPEPPLRRPAPTVKDVEDHIRDRNKLKNFSGGDPAKIKVIRDRVNAFEAKHGKIENLTPREKTFLNNLDAKKQKLANLEKSYSPKRGYPKTPEMPADEYGKTISRKRRLKNPKGATAEKLAETEKNVRAFDAKYGQIPQARKEIDSLEAEWNSWMKNQSNDAGVSVNDTKVSKPDTGVSRGKTYKVSYVTQDKPKFDIPDPPKSEIPRPEVNPKMLGEVSDEWDKLLDEDPSINADSLRQTYFGRWGVPDGVEPEVHLKELSKKHIEMKKKAEPLRRLAGVDEKEAEKYIKAKHWMEKWGNTGSEQAKNRASTTIKSFEAKHGKFNPDDLTEAKINKAKQEWSKLEPEYKQLTEDVDTLKTNVDLEKQVGANLYTMEDPKSFAPAIQKYRVVKDEIDKIDDQLKKYYEMIDEINKVENPEQRQIMMDKAERFMRKGDMQVLEEKRDRLSNVLKELEESNEKLGPKYEMAREEALKAARENVKKLSADEVGLKELPKDRVPKSKAELDDIWEKATQEAAAEKIEKEPPMPGSIMLATPDPIRQSELTKTRFAKVIDTIGNVISPMYQISKPVVNASRKYHNQAKLDAQDVKSTVNKIMDEIPSVGDRKFLSRHLDDPTNFKIEDYVDEIMTKGDPATKTKKIADLTKKAEWLREMTDPTNPMSWAAKEKDLGILRETVNNYMAHIYEAAPEDVRRSMDHLMKRAKVEMGGADRHTMERIIKTFDDAINAGLKPKLDAAEIMGIRQWAGQKAIRTKQLVEDLTALGSRYVRPLEINLSPEQEKAAIEAVFAELEANHFFQRLPEADRKTFRQLSSKLMKRFNKFGMALQDKTIARFMDEWAEKMTIQGTKIPFATREPIKSGFKNYLSKHLKTPRGFIRTDDLFGPNNFNPMPDQAVSEDIAKYLMNEFKPYTHNRFIRTVDRVTGWWKGLATGVNPAFHTRNAIGNLWTNYVADVDPKTYTMAAAAVIPDESIIGKNKWAAQGLDKARKKVYTDKLGRKWTIPEMMTLAEKHGVVGEGWFGREIGTAIKNEIDLSKGGTKEKWKRIRDQWFELNKQRKKLKAAGKGADPKRFYEAGQELAKEIYRQKPSFFKGGRAIGDFIESNARLAHFMDRLLKGDNAQSAAESVYKYLFNYQELGKAIPMGGSTFFEVRRWVPFFSWMRGNIPLQLEMIARKPGKYAMVNKIKRFLEGETETDRSKRADLPGWLREGTHVRLPKRITDSRGNPVIARLGLPQDDIANVLSARELAGSVTPLLKEPIQQLFNRDLYFQSNIVREGLEDNPDLQTVRADDIFRHLAGTPLGNFLNVKVMKDKNGRRRVEMDARKLHALKAMYRPASELGKLTDPATDTDQRVLNFTGPAKFYSFDPHRQGLYKEYERQRKLRAMLRKLRREQVRGGIGRGTGS